MQRSLLRMAGLTVVLSLSAAAFAGDAEDDPLNDPEVQKTLRAMSDASTWYHPDLFGEFAGVKRYTNKSYDGAMKYFKVGAYYADKFSQLSIGLMYVNGEGRPKDLLTGYAWLDIAAERDYPDFVATRDRVKASLSPEELRRAQAIRDELASRYGDSVAKPRMEQQLRWGLEQMTGSRLGSDFGVLHISAVDTPCKGSVVVGGLAIPEAGCSSNDIYAESRWVPAKYFARRDSQWKATVTVGDIQSSEKATPSQGGRPAPVKEDKPLPLPE